MNETLPTLQQILADQTPAGREPGASKLDPFMDQLLALRDQGYSLRQLEQALAQSGVKAAPSEISRYLKRKSTS